MGVRAVSDHEIPRTYLSMRLRVYSLNVETGERTYLPVSEPGPANASFNGPCTCPECRTEHTDMEQAAGNANAARLLERAGALAAKAAHDAAELVSGAEQAVVAPALERVGGR